MKYEIFGYLHSKEVCLLQIGGGRVHLLDVVSGKAFWSKPTSIQWQVRKAKLGAKYDLPFAEEVVKNLSA